MIVSPTSPTRPLRRSFVHAVALAVLAAMIVSAGCGARPATIATVEPVKARPRPTSIAILRFDDVRVIRDLNPKMQNIPILIWWATTRKSQFDRANRSMFGDFFMGIFADRLKQELEKTNGFRTVAVVSAVEEARNYPLLVRGRIVEGSREGTILPWGFGFLAKYVWLLGLPKSTHHWDFEVQYEVVRTVDAMPSATGAPTRVEPFLKPFSVRNESRTRTQTAYSDTANVDEVFEAIDNLSAAAAAQILNGLPAAGTPQLASLVDAHDKWLREEELKLVVLERLAPPTVRLATIPPGDTLRQPDLILDWGIDAVGGIRTASLTHNNRQVEILQLRAQMEGRDKDSAPRSYPGRDRVELDLGRNVFRVAMTDWIDQSATAEIAVTRLPRVLYTEPRTAVIVGVSQYQRGALAGMDTPGARNAEALERFLTDPYGGQMPASSVRSLVDGAATVEAVTEALRSVVSRTRQGDTVLVYFSGLSLAIDRSGPAYLLLADTDLDNLGPTALGIDQVRQLLEESQADNLLLIVDSAYPVGDYELHAQGALVEMARRLRNVGVLVSTDRPEVRALPRGKTFTDLMLAVMRPSNDLDRDGAISIDEMSEGLRTGTSEEGLPFPRLTGRYERTLPLKMLE